MSTPSREKKAPGIVGGKKKVSSSLSAVSHWKRPTPLVTRILSVARELAKEQETKSKVRSPVGHHVTVAAPGYASPWRSLLSADHTYYIVLPRVLNLTSNGVGTISTTFGADPQFLTEWSSLAAIFDVFYTARIDMKFVPTNKYFTATKTTRMVAFANDRDSSLLPTTYDSMVQREHTLSDMTSYHTHVWMAPPLADSSGFVDVGTPASMLGGIAAFGEALSNSTEYGFIVTNHYLMFRYRQ